MLTILTLSAIVASLPHPSGIEHTNDVLIRNWVHDERTGEVTLDQIGGLDWMPICGHYGHHWQWWVMTDKATIPRRDRGGYVVQLYRGKHRYTIRAPVYFEQHSVRDLELVDRVFLPQSERRSPRGW